MEKGMSIVNYYSKRKQLWDELANYDHMAMCKCRKCECNLGSILVMGREEGAYFSYKVGRNNVRMVRSNLLVQDPLQNLGKVYSILIKGK